MNQTPSIHELSIPDLQKGFEEACARIEEAAKLDTNSLDWSAIEQIGYRACWHSECLAVELADPEKLDVAEIATPAITKLFLRFLRSGYRLLRDAVNREDPNVKKFERYCTNIEYRKRSLANSCSAVMV